MSGPWDIEKIDAAFAAAALDSAFWNTAMERVSELTGSFGAVLFPGVGRQPNLPHSPCLAPSVESYVRDGWIHRDERYRCVPTMARRGVATDFDFITPDQIARHPYYQEFLAPHGLQWAAIVKMEAPDETWALSIQRTIQQGPFSQEELSRLAALSRTLSHAAAVAHALDLARTESGFAAFELSGSAIVLLNRLGEVHRINTAAEVLLDTDLQIVRKRLVSTNADATAALDRAFHALIWNPDSSVLTAPVVLPRRDKRPMIAHFLRLPAFSADAFSVCQAIVVLIDLDRRQQPPESVLRSAFGLSAAEAKLAVRLAAGDTLEKVAGEIGVAYETGRNQLKAIFAKTDTHRQAELVALLARMALRDRTQP